MRIAILGATSEIARDLVAALLEYAGVELFLYARRPQAVHDWLVAIGKTGTAKVFAFDDFLLNQKVDALINFVGIGNPAQARILGASILELTQMYDDWAIKYLHKYPNCRYIFLSSGAVYGNSFERPVTTQSLAQVRINHLHKDDWYTVAKIYAEYRHRAIPDAGIVDLRVFNYFSHTQKMDTSFLMADVVSAVTSDTLLRTSNINIVRDYLHPSDFHRLVSCILQAPMSNTALDCFSRAPVDKFSLLEVMRTHFGLKYIIDDALPASDVKLNYYSLNRSAENFGYQPGMDSIDGILLESKKLFSNHMI